MTQDEIAVLRAVPGSRAPGATLGQIADKVQSLVPMLVCARIDQLTLMGLVEPCGDGWSRTPLGDQEAGKGRASHGR